MFTSYIMVILTGYIVFVVIKHGLIKIPKVHKGVLIFLGKRTNWILDEGLNWIPPWISEVEIISLKPQNMKISSNFLVFSKDKRAADPELALSIEPDLGIKSQAGNGPRYIEIDDEMKNQRFPADLKSLLRSFIGLNEHTVFIEPKTLELIINAIARLDRPPHVNPVQFFEDYKEFIDEEHKDIIGEKLAEYCPNFKKIEIKKESRYDFYKDFSGPIHDILRKEENLNKKRSRLEMFYGINILPISLENFDFSDESKRAIESQQRVRDELMARDETQQWRMKRAQEMKDFGLSPKDSVDGADVVLDIASKKVVSVSGGSNSNLLIDARDKD